MTNSNFGTEQTSVPCNNQNFTHPLQRNGDVLSDRRELAGGLSASVEILVSAGWGWWVQHSKSVT